LAGRTCHEQHPAASTLGYRRPDLLYRDGLRHGKEANPWEGLSDVLSQVAVDLCANTKNIASS
jgi:hypothetical protein